MTALWRIWVPALKHAPIESAVQQYAQSLFSAEMQLVQTDVDHRFVLSVQKPGQPKALLVRCQSRLCTEAVEDHAIAKATVEKMGGAGMDVLLARGVCLWSWDATDALENQALSQAQTMVAGVLAMSELGCVLLPNHQRMVGLRGVREWLEHKSRNA